MKSPFVCDDLLAHDLAIRYLQGQLTPEEEEQLELHILACEQCADEIRFAAALDEVAQAKPRRFFTWRVAGVAAGFATAAAIVLVVMQPDSPSAVRLGGVDAAPIYLGMTVRSDASTADSLFGAAMRSYQQEDFAAAAAGLRAALEADVERPGAEFFLASSLLMLGDAAAARDYYRRVISYGETPYLAEARFYLAKALLRGGRAADAARELWRLATDEHELSAHAAALADSVEAIATR
ncbi:MAG: hypothetical protein ACT4O1_15280 [Gemmatimonadota bacterium]